MISCCHNCELRHLNCHSTCETYIAQKAEHDAQRAKARAIDDARKRMDVIDYERRIAIRERQNRRR